MKKRQFILTAIFLWSLFSAAQEPVPRTIPLSAPASVPAPPDVEKMRSQLSDWPNLARHRMEDAAISPPAPGEKRVVFLDDSITDRWGRKVGTFFSGKGYLNRGIGGQTTPQMLINDAEHRGWGE